MFGLRLVYLGVLRRLTCFWVGRLMNGLDDFVW